MDWLKKKISTAISAVKVERAVSNSNEETIYAQAAMEVGDNEVRPGLWAKALAESDGNESRAKGRYIALRVAQIKLQLSAAESLTEKPLPSVLAQTSTQPSPANWSKALAEVENAREPGLWAKSFAEASGDQAIASANYLRTRAHELQEAEDAEAQSQRQEDQRQRAANAFADVVNRKVNDIQAIQACEDHLVACGFRIHKEHASKWEIIRGQSSTFAHSASDLISTTKLLTKPKQLRA